jgi:holo-[acyl-carrier protein] synthase
MIYGVGVDLMNIQRMQQVVERWGDKFLKRVFTADETQYCLQFSFPPRHLAGIFAAKEAVLKALGTGLSQGISWQEVQIKAAKGRSPKVELSGIAAQLTQNRGVGNILISLSHDTGYAVAQAVALKGSA